jgi:hypothetical protein
VVARFRYSDLKEAVCGCGRRAEHHYQQLDVLRLLRQEVRRDLLVEAKKHKARKLLRQIPGSVQFGQPF